MFTLCHTSLYVYHMSTTTMCLSRCISTITLCQPSVHHYQTSTTITYLACLPSVFHYPLSTITLFLPSVHYYHTSTICLPLPSIKPVSTICLPLNGLYQYQYHYQWPCVYHCHDYHVSITTLFLPLAPCVYPVSTNVCVSNIVKPIKSLTVATHHFHQGR